MSTFPAVIRFAFLRIKKEHPGWGADVARPRVAERLDLPEEEMPSVSTIGRYWVKFKCKYSWGYTPSCSLTIYPFGQEQRQRKLLWSESCWPGFQTCQVAGIQTLGR